jgi:putative nucleotidyltransferase with HDIG domain
MQLAKLMPQRAAKGYDSEALWQHSLVVASVAAHLAARQKCASPGLASTIGLLHDIGKLAINSLFPDAVAKLWEPSPSTAPADESFLARERRLFGADHAFIGGFLAAQWKLPGELADAIRMHHVPWGDQSRTGDPALAFLSPELGRATRIVHVANQLAKYSHVYCADMEIDIISPETLAGVGLPPQVEDLLTPELSSVIQRACSLCAAAGGSSGPANPAHPKAA